MAAVSGNTGSAPLIGSKVIWDRESNSFVWNETRPLDPRLDTRCVGFEVDWAHFARDLASDGVERHL